mmetsp:Transcript_26289/g.55899  ORF Transcript_26289/g.55899 Transcript_26289/m.55899 type:complete len:352 (-) Transcript_26289:881-1936(-)|eukprot:CAMPEP_0172536172 /NCGR_PEP_ID=MMETSP1067-20121228/7977_1 /TAXON_ID=265564 ORGANISM="Thalassiosira punctigera, Strain Tpunct2005C2" /NCGR_SAMPLE_ID=MMETSP1067 /ASSEMBLY_ACC=CAM_ASM_000444 /LENGTH=351 /DNA_ID=CAMNT_0013321199 /DNA_START=26 /DNA_END=1081 /DNA_ORIENTATION=+
MVAVGKSSSIFLGWTASQGIETPLELAQRADGRYMTCKEEISAGDDVLRIPLSACITANTLESLAERLAYERDLGSKSKYAPYINVLPTLEGDDERPSLLSLPRFWDSKRLEKVTDGGLLEAKMKNDERKDIDPWALACVDSRANFLGGERYSMTPILDMISHDGSVPTRARVSEDKGFAGSGDILCLSSGSPYSKGEEAFISYGNLANIDTLSDYGFVTENNPCNSESVGVQMMRREPLSVTVFADGSVDSGAKATLRYYLANEEELEIFSSLDTKGSGLGILARPLSDRNELDVQSFIASTLDEATYDAKSGAAEAADDGLVSLYLNERARLLDRAIQRIKTKYPDLEY